MEFILLNLLVFILSLGFSIVLIPYIISWCKKRNVLAYDMNKTDRTKHFDTARLGGLGAYMAFILAITITLAVRNILKLDFLRLNLLYPMLLSATNAAFVGFIDDVLIFIHRPIKPILGIIAAIPLASLTIENNSSILHFPFIGPVDFGIFFAILIIPLLISFTSNAFNTMADFDGLAPLNGIIMALALLVIFSFTLRFTSIFFLLALVPPLLVLWHYNHMPSRLFLGDTGTLFIGAVLGIAAVGANRELAVLILFTPYLVHFMLQCRYPFDHHTLLARPCERGIPQKNGTIKSEYTRSYGLTHFLMIHIKKMTERKLVYTLALIELAVALLAIWQESPNLRFTLRLPIIPQ